MWPKIPHFISYLSDGWYLETFQEHFGMIEDSYLANLMDPNRWKPIIWDENLTMQSFGPKMKHFVSIDQK